MIQNRILIISNSDYPPIDGSKSIYYYFQEFSKYTKTIIYCKKDSGASLNVFSAKINYDNKLICDLVFSIKSAFFVFTHSDEFDTVYIINPLIFSFIILMVVKVQNKKSCFDIRTGPISMNRLVNLVTTFFINVSIFLSNSVVVIHKGLITHLGLNVKNKNLIISGLGFNKTEETRARIVKKFDFIYVGSLDKRRNISTLVLAFNKLKYTLLIVGSGNELENLKSISSKNVFFTGNIPFFEVRKYLKRSRFGISYIPVVPIYQFQPPFKTVEYLSEGLPVIATNTVGNEVFIDETNGLLTGDSEKDIIRSVKIIVRKSFNKHTIIKSVDKYSWTVLCKEIFLKLS